MGLFSKNEPVEIDAGYERAVINEDARGLRKTLKLLGKNQLAITATVADGEDVVAIVGHGGHDPEIFSHVLVITDKRLLNFKRGRLDGPPLQQSDIGRTRLFNQPNGGFMATVETHEGMMYPSSDMRHFAAERYLAVQLNDPQLTQGVCGIIDGINGLTN